MEKKQLELWKRHQIQQQQQQQGSGLVALQTKGRALKVHAGDTPHLVSLGGDRFSTAVTLHPISDGHVKLGCGTGADVPIFGTGVEELHCWIENKEGVVTLYPYPGVESILVDGLKVTQPTRLTQGCMLCLGRSNFLRFNHPQEARYMRSVMPNTRVSIMPNVFYPSTIGDRLNGSASLISNSKAEWRSLNGGELGSIDSYYFSKHISPKVFPPGSSTLNSPASVVLGYKYSNQLSLAHSKSATTTTTTSSSNNISDNNNNGDDCKQLALVGDKNDNNNNNGDISENNDSNGSIDNYIVNTDTCSPSIGNSIIGSSESVYQKQRLAIPSPAFDRNPSYFSSTVVTGENRHSGGARIGSSNNNSPTSSECFGGVDGNVSPISLSSPRSVTSNAGDYNNVRRFSPIERNFSPLNYSPSSLTSFNDSSPNGGYASDGSVKKEVVKRSQQLHNSRLVEMEKERLERLRLEEILTLCAEYEKQAQFDRSKSQLSKIKTNGSLPRDKKHCTPSPGCKTPDSPRNGLVVFTFDKSDSSTKSDVDSIPHSNNNVRDLCYPSSPRSRIKTVASPKDPSREHALELYENKLAVLNNCEILNVSTNSARRTTIGHKERRGKQQSILTNGGGNDEFVGFDRENFHSRLTDEVNDNKKDSRISDDNNNNKASLKEMNIRNRYKFFGVNPVEWRNNSNNINDDDRFQYHRYDGNDEISAARSVDNNSGGISSLIEFASNDKGIIYGDVRNNGITSVMDVQSPVSLPFLNNENTTKYEETGGGGGINRSTTRDSDIEKLNGLVLELNEIVKETELSLSSKDDDGKQKRGDNTINDAATNSSGFHSDDSITASSSGSGGRNSCSNSENSSVGDGRNYSIDNNHLITNNGMKLSPSPCSSLARSRNNNKNRTNNNNNNNDSRFILPLDQINTVLKKQCFTLKKNELKKLQDEQTLLLTAINDIKLKLADIQQQKDEIMKELEIEKALVEAEFKSENSKLVKEEETVSGVQIRIKDCESAIEVCSKSQMERQAHNTEMINERQAIIIKLEQSLSDDNISDENTRKQILYDIRKKQDQLDDEVKKFEDFEFKLLEEEAVLLSRREELQAEFQKINVRIEELRSRVSGLFSQKEQLLQNASDEIRSLELQVRSHTYSLQQNHRRLQEISLQLKSTARSLSEISECDTDSSDDIINCSKTQSQEDLDRISRVTSDAPIMESRCTNSLGRRTIASLQEIERNRQLHLAHQGSRVIEEERRRVLALKQRVQNEVKARWEEQKQRENCNSFNSDNSSLTSFERITESPINDEIKKFSEDDGDSIDVIENKDPLPITNSMRDEENGNLSRRRNMSNASSHHDGTSSVRFTQSTKSIGGNNIQRPESHHSMRKRESFDLRRHIESAGHLLDRCPQVIIDATSCRGYLHKMTTKFRTWNKRWFVFDRTKCSFAYYTDKSEKKMRSGTYFQGLIDLYIDKGNLIKSAHPNATFVVKSAERTFYLMAPSVEAMRIWFDVIATEVDVYHDP